MKIIIQNWKYIIMAVLVIIIFSLIQCQGETKTEVTYKDKVVKIPEIIGTLKPNSILELPSEGTDSIVYRDRKIYSTHPLDKVWAERVKNAKDSIQTLSLLIEAIQVKEQTTDFSNKNLELKVWTKTRGELKNIEVDFKILEKEIVIQEKTITNTVYKKDNFGTIIGGGYNHSLDANVNSNFEVNAGIRLGKVTILGSANTQKQVGGKLLLEF